MICAISARKSLIGVLILALVLAAPFLAAAECAWVLWTAADDARGQRSWAVASSFPKTLVSGADVGWLACKKELDERIFPAIERQLAEQQKGESKTPWVKNPWAVCLPDTIDPRGPKGGSR